MAKRHRLVSTRATATVSGIQHRLPRRGRLTGSRASREARAGATPAVASIRSDLYEWLSADVGDPQFVDRETAVDLYPG